MNYTNNQIHVHTDASLNDGAQNVADAIATLSKMGATSAAITDHGLCANWLPWYNACIRNKINPILGVEAYIKTEGYYEMVDFLDKEVNQHLLLLAMNYKGLQAISRFVSECNRHLNSLKKPIGTKAMIEKFFGEGSDGYGNVICTTACIAGPIATVLSKNFKLDREIQKIMDRNVKVLEGLPENFQEISLKVADAEKNISLYQIEVDALSEKAKRTFKIMKEEIKLETDPESKARMKEIMLKEQDETKAAKAKTKEIKAKIKAIKDSVSEEKKLLSKCSAKSKTMKENLDKINMLEQVKQDEATLLKEASSELLFYKGIFGENLYAEVQYHGIELEAYLYPLIAKIAKANNVSLVASNDVHMATKFDLKKRTLIQNCGYITSAKKFKPAQVGDSELYFKTGSELADMLRQILPEESVMEAMSNIDAVCNKCHLPQLVDSKNGAKCFSLEKHYPNFDNADEKLKELVTTGHTVVSAPGVEPFDIYADGIKGRYSDFPERYKKQLEYELRVISTMKFSSYFLFIADVISYCKRSRVNTLEIGPGRGSGAGSIVCYLANITELEPMKNNLLFERE